MDDVSEMIGRVLLDRYEVLERVGHGASSVVYRCLDRRYSRMVALKILRPELSVAVGSTRFLREIQHAARLQHPHILPLYDSGEVDGLPFYVMPYVEGQSLREELARRGPLPVNEAAIIAGEVGSALAYAHEQGLVHRDVKPENVLLTAGHAVVADFGIARALDVAGGETLTSAGFALGTPKYMSPEQFGDGEIDERSDVYSMGCLVYEMLTGEAPYAGSNAQALFARHVQDPIPDAHATRPDVPHELSGVVSRSLAKPPDERYSTATEFVEALAPFATPGAKGTRQIPWLRTAAVALLVAVAGTAVIGIFSSDPPDDRKVMVFPLAELTLPPDLRGAGFDVALMVGAAMEQTDPLRWVEGAARLDSAQRANLAELPARALAEVALATRSRYYLDGAVRGDDDSIRVTLRMHDALGDSLVGRRTVAAGLGEAAPYSLALRALPQLLPALLEPGRVIDLTPLTDRDPAAVALFIQGERAYRTRSYSEALDFYRRAVGQDSSFAFAGVKGAMAASWQSDLSGARELSAHALRHAHLLPPVHRMFATGLDAFWAGDADSAASVLTQVVDTAGDWAEAHAALGDVYYHFLPTFGGVGDSVAKIAFDSARVLDPQLSKPFFHLAQIHLRHGQADSADALLRSMRDITDGAEIPNELEFAVRCARDGAEASQWDRWAEDDSVGALAAAKNLAVGYAHPACAEAGLRAVLAGQEDPTSTYSFASILGLQALYVASGRYDEAIALLDGAFEAGSAQMIFLYVMNTVAGAPFESQAAEGDVFARNLYGEAYEGMRRPFTVYIFGIWSAFRHDVEQTRVLYERLGEIARSSGDPFEQSLFEALAAHLALAEGDTPEAIRILRALRTVAPHTSWDWGMAEALPVERLLLARLLLSEGEYAEAERVAAGFDHPEPMIYLAFLAQSLSLRHEAARALGRPDRAAVYQARLDRLTG